jgi:cyclopropane fatty-acyl-phospholipid synthase-like methyltransferase
MNKVNFYSNYYKSKNLNLQNDLISRRYFYEYILKKFFPKNLNCNIIDIGAGYGPLEYFARKKNFKNITSLDLSNDQVEKSQELDVKVIKCNALEYLKDIKDESVDIIVAIDLVEHLSLIEFNDLLKEIYRSLKKNSYFLFHTNNSDSPLFGSIRYGDITHKASYNESSLNQILVSNSFSKLSFFESGPFVHNIKSLIRFFLWKIIRQIYNFFYIVESGSSKKILTMNLFCYARK